MLICLSEASAFLSVSGVQIRVTSPASRVENARIIHGLQSSLADTLFLGSRAAGSPSVTELLERAMEREREIPRSIPKSSKITKRKYVSLFVACCLKDFVQQDKVIRCNKY